MSTEGTKNEINKTNKLKLLLEMFIDEQIFFFLIIFCLSFYKQIKPKFYGLVTLIIITIFILYIKVELPSPCIIIIFVLEKYYKF